MKLLVTNPDTEYLNKSVMYQMFLRAFTPEGTLKSAERMLPYLADLGIDIVYLCPCFKMGSRHRRKLTGATVSVRQDLATPRTLTEFRTISALTRNTAQTGTSVVSSQRRTPSA